LGQLEFDGIRFPDVNSGPNGVTLPGEFLFFFLFGWLCIGVNRLEGVCTRKDITQQSRKPELEGRPLDLVDASEFFDSRSVELTNEFISVGLIHKSGHPKSDILHIPIACQRRDT
jgi:hypothetical protein